MATQVTVTPQKTYATPDNARAAIAKYPHIDQDANLRYVIMQNDQGRYYVAFIGERAVQAGCHFAGFAIIG